jgi:di/tricarboxylate transporter
VTGDTLFVFLLVVVATVLLATDKIRFDVVALLVLVSLAASGVLTEREVLAGFGDPVVIIVAGLLVVGEMLARTGIAFSIGEWMARSAGDSEVRLLILLMLVAGLLGSVMSSTAVVAILIPVVSNATRRSGLNPSRFLMPMAFGALISGMLTLIGTPANLVVSGELESWGYAGFGFFSFAPVGIAVLGAAIVYIVVLGRHLLPGERQPVQTPAAGVRDMLEEFGLLGRFHRLRISPGSPLAGRTLREAQLSERGVRVSVVEERRRVGVAFAVDPGPDLTLKAGDAVLVNGEYEATKALMQDLALERLPISDTDRRRWVRSVGVATLLVHPESSLLGKSLEEVGFRARFGFQALALRRGGELLADFTTMRLRAGDALLVQGAWRRIERLRDFAHDFVVLTVPVEAEIGPETRKAPIAVTILAGMIALSTLGTVPVSVAVLGAALAAVLTGCISMEAGYRAIHWRVIVLLGGMLPLADALEQTGGVTLIVEGLTAALGGSGPDAMLSALFVLSAGLSLVLSNTVTAVLVAPIAILAAQGLGLEPQAFVMTVAIGASAAFGSPVASPVVALVAEPGRYGFRDFVRVGAPLLIVTWALTMLIVPRVFPL